MPMPPRQCRRSATHAPAGLRAGLACAALAALLGACAQASPGAGDTAPGATAGPQGAGMRVLLQTAADWPDATQAAARAAQLAGVPVAEARALGPRRFVMLIACGDAAGCERALARMRAGPGFAESVEIDSRERRPARPAPSSAY